MVAVPAETPVTIPESEPTEAINDELLLQVPPVEVLLKVIVLPAHTAFAPVMAAAAGLIVMVFVARQPVANT